MPELSPRLAPTDMAADAGPGEQQYSLRWNDFHSSMLSSFRHLREQEDFVDVTLACEGQSFSAHKVVLSACSPYFRNLLKANPCQHPIVILKDVHNKDMESLLRFMYHGEVHIGQDQLPDFLKAASLLQVRGLTDVPGVPLKSIESQKKSPQHSSGGSWTESTSGEARTEGRSRTRREGHNGDDRTPPPKRARSSDLYNEQLKTRTEQLLAQERSPDRLGANGLDLRDSILSHGLDHTSHNNISNEGDETSSDASDTDEPRNSTKQEPLDYGDDSSNLLNSNGGILDPSRTPNFPGALLNLQGLLPGTSGMHGADNFGSRRAHELMRVRATDPRPCPKCGKIYRSAHTLRTHLEDKHTVCPGYRCVLCGTVAKSRNSLHSHMSRQHRGISTKDLPVLPMPSQFDPELASKLLAKAGVKVSAAELRARASPTSGRRPDFKLDAKSANSETSSIAGDHDDYHDNGPISPPSFNHLANTTITKVPAVRALAAKTMEGAGRNLGGRHDSRHDAAALGGSEILNTYMQYIADFGMGFSPDRKAAALQAAKFAQMNAFCRYDNPNSPPNSSPPEYPPSSRRYDDGAQPLDLGRRDDDRSPTAHERMNDCADQAADLSIASGEEPEAERV